MRNLHYILLLITLLFNGFSASAQVSKKIPADKQRATQWKPEKGQYYFSHSLVFAYEDKDENKKGEIKIYLDPVTGAMCFRKESSFGEGGKTFDFILAFPDGRYMHCGSDTDGKKIKTIEKVEDVKPGGEIQAQQKETFDTYCKPTGNKRMDFGFESLEYELSYATSELKDKIWIAETPFNVYPLYGIELIEAAASLPVGFDYLYLLGPNQLLTELASKEINITLKSFGIDPFLAVTRNYQEIKVND